MVPQMPSAGMPTPFSQLIPVPSATVAVKQEPMDAPVPAGPKQAAAVVPEQPLTRAERVARCASDGSSGTVLGKGVA
jgi:hypothetical protein